MHSHNHCCLGKALSITYSECVPIFLNQLSGMQSTCAALYCHLWSLWLYHIFPYYLINGTIFIKNVLNIKCVFQFSLQLLSETFLILENSVRYCHKCT